MSVGTISRSVQKNTCGSFFSIRITDQHPSDGCWRVATPIPKSDVRYDLKRRFLGVIPARYDDLCPPYIGRGQKAFGFGECLAFDTGPTQLL